MLNGYVRRIALAFGTPVELLVLPDQLMLTEASRTRAPRAAVVKATPGLSRIDQVMDLWGR